jgi:hypothetical protein
MDKQLIVIACPGHSNGEFLAWLLNHSPDCPQPSTTQWTMYTGFLGKHYRAEDSATLDWFQPLGSLYRKFDRPDPPEYKCDLNKLETFTKAWNNLKTDQTDLCIYINCTNSQEIIDSKIVDLVGRPYWDMPNYTHRHFHSVMEFDPGSTEEQGTNRESYNQIAAQLVKQHVSQVRDIQNTNYDFIVWQSKIFDMFEVMKIFDTCRLTKPHSNYMLKAIQDYHKINEPTHEYCTRLNSSNWDSLCDIYLKERTIPDDFQVPHL